MSYECTCYVCSPPEWADEPYPLRFTRRRMVRARKRYNAGRRQWPDKSAASIRWDTFTPEEQAQIALDMQT